MSIWKPVLIAVAMLFAACQDADVTPAEQTAASTTGSPCSKNNDCASKQCTDGVCCTTACGGGTNDCQACSVAAGGTMNGTCTPRVSTAVCRAGTGPCDPAETCNGTTTSCPADQKAPSGTTCDDNNGCTTTDRCDGAGTCQGADPVTCTAQGECRDVGVCDPATGECTDPRASNGKACDDENACTQADTCQEGLCIGGDPVLCQATDPCQTTPVCDPTTGTCTSTAVADNTPCDDGNPCTQVDTCQAGTCAGGEAIVCAPINDCRGAGMCDPSTGTCTSPPLDDGTPCDDGNACTQADTCAAGECASGPAITCTALDECHVAGTCDPATGACTNPPAENGTACNDGDACSRADACHNGTCVGNDRVACTAQDECHIAGVCDPATGVCSNPSASNETECSDGNECTQADRCQDGECVGSDPVSCPATNGCQTPGTCDPGTGVCTNVDVPNGTPCDDANPCTTGEACASGSCVGGEPTSGICPAPTPCRLPGECDPATGLCDTEPAPDGTLCDDGNPCTAGDTCQAGACTAGEPVDGVCPAPGPCQQTGVCDPNTGGCIHEPVPDGTSCDDDDACTRMDVCRDGACVGDDPVVCRDEENFIDLDFCMTPTCDPTTGACTGPTPPEGTPCPTGTCHDGQCVATDAGLPVTNNPPAQVRPTEGGACGCRVGSPGAWGWGPAVLVLGGLLLLRRRARRAVGWRSRARSGEIAPCPPSSAPTPSSRPTSPTP